MNSIPVEEYRTNLEVLADIADVYMLKDLAATVESILQAIPA
jgi:hypothetical protein